MATRYSASQYAEKTNPELYAMSRDIDRAVLAGGKKSPLILSNSRDLYWINTRVEYSNVFFDELIQNRNVNQTRQLINGLAEKGYSHLFFKGTDYKHGLIVSAGARQTARFKLYNARLYELY